jgi:acetyl esterase/lipase
LTALAYSNPDGFPLYLDWFHPDGETVCPVVVCIYGGGWVSGDPSHMHDVAIPLARNGFAAACPEYRLAPQHPYPAACDDLAACVRFLREHADELKIDPKRIASLGNSAGGHLAAWVGLHEHLQAVVDICGVADMTGPEHYYTDIGVMFAEQFFGGPREKLPEAFREASPIFLIDQDAPPFLLVHGEADDIVPIVQSEIMLEALRRNGTPAELIRCPGEGHSFTYPAWVRIESKFMSFLKESLGE